MSMCYRVRKPIKVGADRREPGDLWPEGYAVLRVMHLVHAGYVEETDTLPGELDAALSYVDDPAVLTRFGHPVPEAADEPDFYEEDESAEQIAELFEKGEPVEVTGPPGEELLEEEGSLLDEQPEPSVAKFPREELEELSWPELRKLGAEAGLGRDAKKDDILNALGQ